MLLFGFDKNIRIFLIVFITAGYNSKSHHDKFGLLFTFCLLLDNSYKPIAHKSQTEDDQSR
jgi:hypothetical protein